MEIDQLLELDRKALESISVYDKKRFVFNSAVSEKGRPFLAVIGPRGVGKTVLLRQIRALYPDAIYISADTLPIGTSLSDLIRYVHDSLGIRNFFIDEIHFVQNYAAHLKETYDFLPVHVWFTSSVALALHTSAWDLSRRVRSLRLEPFSLREYIYFRYNLALEPLPLRTVLSGEIPSSHLRQSMYFDEYVKGNLYPFLLEPGSGIGQFSSIREKIIKDDIPNYDRGITMEDVLNIEKSLSFIGTSSIDGINYSSVAKNLGITKYKSEKYLNLLERSFLIRLVFPRGTNVLKEPKVCMELPFRLLFHDYDQCIGEIREDFFTLSMAQHETSFAYLKTMRGQKTPDFLIEGSEVDGRTQSFVVEVGGAGKGRTQFKGVEYGNKVVLYHQRGTVKKPGKAPVYKAGERVPLHTLGFAP